MRNNGYPIFEIKIIKQTKLSKLHSLNEYQKELQKAKKIIQDYEIVHNGPWEVF